jgi:DNA-binding transcriptional LysR family regulator
VCRKATSPTAKTIGDLHAALHQFTNPDPRDKTASIWCQKLPAFFAAWPDMAVEMAASQSPATIIEDVAIHSGDLPDSNLVARRFAQTMTILVATPQYLMRYSSGYRTSW